ncbi:hypothetical protein A4G19_03800 [Pasteurellaceae bacterium Macca]|nr:hypothetical protein [Pasteurellaceae bacterium Macca]
MAKKRPLVSTLAHLYPPVAYQISGEQFLAQCEADARLFERIEQQAKEMLGAISPESAGVMLSDWERVCGISTNLAKSYEERVQRVILQLNAIGGLSLPYFKRLAESIGYQIEIKEFSPLQNDLPNAGDIPIQHAPREDLIFMWRVTVLNADNNVIYFRAGQSLAGDRLVAFGDRIIEEFFKDLKPAHTYCYFAYPTN